jgi:hypothetical protein
MNVSPLTVQILKKYRYTGKLENLPYGIRKEIAAAKISKNIRKSTKNQPVMVYNCIRDPSMYTKKIIIKCILMNIKKELKDYHFYEHAAVSAVINISYMNNTEDEKKYNLMVRKLYIEFLKGLTKPDLLSYVYNFANVLE